MPSREASGAYISIVSREMRCWSSGGNALRVSMLCRRSASLMMTTRRSWAMARNILRRFSAWISSSARSASPFSQGILPSFVTPSTSFATAAPRQLRPRPPEPPLDLFVLDRAALLQVVQQRRRYRVGVQLKRGDRLGRVQGMRYRGIAGPPELTGVARGRELVGGLHLRYRRLRQVLARLRQERFR